MNPKKLHKFKTDRRYETAKTTRQARSESLRRKAVRKTKYTQNQI